MNKHKITINTKDQENIIFECGEDENLILAAEKNNIVLPSGCKNGGCGGCLGICSDGDYHLEKYSPSILSTEDISSKKTLMCQTYPRSDLHIDVNYNKDKILLNQNLSFLATVTEVNIIAQNTIHLVLNTEPNADGCLISFNAGQYVNLEKEGITRSYSMSNAPNWEGRLEFLIKLRLEGSFSNIMREIKIGDHINVSPANGTFSINEQSIAPRWLVAGGTGLAPMLSIIKNMIDLDDQTETNLYFGVNTFEELFFVDEINHLIHGKNNFKFIPCIKTPSSEWNGLIGLPTDFLESDLLKINNLPDIYICGPTALLNKVKDICKNNNISADKIFFEIF